MAAVTFGSIVDEQAVYLTAGAVLPAVIQEVLHSLLNDDFKTAYNTILKVCDESWTCFTIVRCNIDFLPFTFWCVTFYILQRVGESGYAVCDIVTELSARIILIDLPDPGQYLVYGISY